MHTGIPPKCIRTKGIRTQSIRTRRYTNQGIRTKNTLLFKFNDYRLVAHTIGVLPACPFLVLALAPDPVAPPNTTITISTPVNTPVSTTIYLSLSLSAQQPRTRPMQQDAAPPLDAHGRQTKSTARSHQSTSTHDRLYLQLTAPLIDTHTH